MAIPFEKSSRKSLLLFLNVNNKKWKNILINIPYPYSQFVQYFTASACIGMVMVLFHKLCYNDMVSQFLPLLVFSPMCIMRRFHNFCLYWYNYTIWSHNFCIYWWDFTNCEYNGMISQIVCIMVWFHKLCKVSQFVHILFSKSQFVRVMV